jgi:AAA family ATP:ADP antiporter
MWTAMLCAAAVTAQLVGGKATRDALFLTALNVTALPTMLIATSVCSILLVAGHARWSRRAAPSTVVPMSFVISGVLFLAEWLFRAHAPSTTAVVVYLHVSGAAPLLASGFWLIVSERFDPRTAKRRFGQIAGAGTLGGLCGALVAERVAALYGAPSMLLFLAGLHAVTAVLVYRLAAAAAAASPREVVPGIPAYRSGLRVIAETPQLQYLVALVLLGTTGAALLDYVFKVRAVEAFGSGDGLLRFFAWYYAGTSVVSFVLQTTASRAVLERFGLALTTSTPSIALVAGSLASLMAPGLGSLIVARGGEAIFRASWFRAGYELFFTPIPVADKRAAKSVIDVAVDRLGDAAGGGLVRLATVLLPSTPASAIISMAMLASLGAILAASQLSRWYLRTLETSLVSRSRDARAEETQDGSTAIVVEDVRRRRLAAAAHRDTQVAANAAERSDPLLHDIARLRSARREAVINVLVRTEGPAAFLVPHVIPLLASQPIADYAVFALRKIAEEHVGQLTDAMVDPTRDFAVRARLARVFSVAVSQRAADALVLALADERFDVRFQAARSLASIVDRNPRVQLDSTRIYDVISREVAVGRPVWESRRLLDGLAGESPLDEFVRDRAGQSLAHVFTLLSVVLPREPLKIAFRSLHSDDKQLRGTALEYLEGVLPASIRGRLWPFLVYRRPGRPAPSHDAVIANLLRSSQSITLQGMSRSWDKPALAGFGGV